MALAVCCIFCRRLLQDVGGIGERAIDTLSARQLKKSKTCHSPFAAARALVVQHSVLQDSESQDSVAQDSVLQHSVLPHSPAH
ncbi:hypothetical protein [Achromobacter kerstersii]|uniref:hypothetical protein n=1 Tax=Achromobacter kerstersii TaxID=1353890 RepID=UPI0020C69957|nr:hypothetical protein [Achromobacter kerstersii]